MDQNQSQIVHVYQARWVVPITVPPIENGMVVTRNGEIVEVGNAESIRRNWSQPFVDLGDAVILPGLINVHTHLEHLPLSYKPVEFISYLQALQRYALARSLEQRQDVIQQNISECVNTGTVALADFSHDGLSVRILSEGTLFARVFQELFRFKNFDAQTVLRKQLERVSEFASNKKVTAHLAPSSIWGVSMQLFRELSIIERHIAIHFAMSAAEREFTLSGEGVLKQYLLSLDDFDYSWKAPGVPPAQYFFGNHFFARHNILIHMVDVDEADIEVVKRFPTKVNICLCPRSAQVLNLGTPPVQMLLDKRMNICLGTESRVVVPDLDLRKELAACVESYHLVPETAVKFATLNGAYAIGFHKEVGSLEPGKTSRCLVLDCAADELEDPYAAIASTVGTLRWLEE
jgi:5-methylthioadenosine/S-adenosylhomocysteine deaminase